MTPDEVATMFDLLPPHASEGMTHRAQEPTRKQSLLSSVWGRLLFDEAIGHYRGPCLLIGSTPERFSGLYRNLDPLAAAELSRLEMDGHEIRSGRRGVVVESTARASRSTQLFRTVPHEVGHWVDYSQRTRTLGERAGDQDYHRRPAREREEWAHRYAEDTRCRLTAQGTIPFRRTADEAALRSDGLEPVWFHPIETPE